MNGKIYIYGKAFETKTRCVREYVLVCVCVCLQIQTAGHATAWPVIFKEFVVLKEECFVQLENKTSKKLLVRNWLRF